MTLRELTPRQADTLSHIELSIAANGYPPTVGELARSTGLCRSRVREVLAALERQGAIARGKDDGRSLPRAIRVTPRAGAPTP